MPQSQSDGIEQTEESQSTEGAQEYFLVPGQSEGNEGILAENEQEEELDLQHVYIEGNFKHPLFFSRIVNNNS